MEQINVQINNSAGNNENETMTCSESSKGDRTGDTCATDMKQISIWLANKAGKI